MLVPRRLPACSRRLYATTLSARPIEQDVTIIGGGPAGLSLLASLARSPVTRHLKTTLVEASDLGKIEHWQEKDGEWTNRVSSVTNENRRWLESAFDFLFCPASVEEGGTSEKCN